MRGRDLAIVAAVVLLGGFALADSLRSRASEPEATATRTTETSRDDDGPAPQDEAPADWPVGRIQGTLVFTDADDCRVRVIGLAGGRERPTGDFFGTCELWPAPIGQRIAYGAVPTERARTAGLTVVDLAHANRALGTFRDLAGSVVWSPDAQRVAWCDGGGFGRELEIGDTRPRRLERCPVAYDPVGDLAFAVGRRLVAEDRRVLLTERDPIVGAHWGTDESLLVVLAGGTVRRYGADGRIDTIALFTDVGDVIPSPTNCAIIYSEPGRVHIADVGCAGIREPSFIAYDAAWSPDGRWVAVADTEQIEFHELLTGDERLVWPARAIDLYWRGD